MTRTPLSLLLALLLASGLAAGQSNETAAEPRINRNPAFRENLPEAAPLPPDPRDSTTRPVLAPDDDGRATVITPSPAPNPRAGTVAAPGQSPASAGRPLHPLSWRRRPPRRWARC